MNNTLKKSLFLFDIDGTILSTEGDGKKAFVKACETMLDSPVGVDIDFRGGIDYVVLKSVFGAHRGENFDIHSVLHTFKEHYLPYLKQLSLESEHWILFKDALEIIRFLWESSNIALVTGNVQEGAMIKLEHFDLQDYFKTGGFGDRAETRGQMVSKAIQQSHTIFDTRFESEDIFLIGDTQKDIDSALENSIIPIFVDHYRQYDSIKNNKSVIYVQDFNTLIEKIKQNSLI